jgi:hypothetical protein
MEAGGRRIEVGRVIGETFSLYGAHAAVLLATAAVVFIVAGVAANVLAVGLGLIGSLLGSIISLVAITLYTGFVVKLVEDVRDGKRDFRVGELLSSAAGVLGSLIGNSILKAIAVVVGLVLLIVPGLFLLTIWAVTAPAIVVERRGAIEAFGRSHELVRGQAWQVFGVIVVAFLITVAVSIVIGALGTLTGDVGQVIILTIGNIITAPIAALVSAVLFFDLGGGVGAGAPAATAAAPPPSQPAPPPTA